MYVCMYVCPTIYARVYLLIMYNREATPNMKSPLHGLGFKRCAASSIRTLPLQTRTLQTSARCQLPEGRVKGAEETTSTCAVRRSAKFQFSRFVTIVGFYLLRSLKSKHARISSAITLPVESTFLIKRVDIISGAVLSYC